MTDRIIYELTGHTNPTDILTLADAQAVFAPAATPQAFGAVANGITDAHTALQAWLDAGGSLSSPAGAYFSSDNLILRKSATIECAGYGFDARIVDGSLTL